MAIGRVFTSHLCLEESRDLYDTVAEQDLTGAWVLLGVVPGVAQCP